MYRLMMFGLPGEITMALNSSGRDSIVLRRKRVANMRLQNKTQREIAAVCGVSVSTINNDLKVLKRQWMKEANIDIAEHTARQLAEVRMVKEWAYLDRDGRIYLQALKLEAQLLGTLKTPGVEIHITMLARVFAQVFSQYQTSSEAPDDLVSQFFKLLAGEAVEHTSPNVITMPRAS